MGAFISWIKKEIPTDDSRAGSAQGGHEKSASLSGMISTLVPALLYALVVFALFLVFRRSQRRFYAPRTYLGSLRKEERSEELPGGLLNWFGRFWKIPDSEALKHQSLDAYFFMRFLRISAIICFVAACITWPILFPVYATGGKGNSQLEILSFSNIDLNKKKNYYYAPLFVSWAVYGFVMYMILRELIFYINLRQAFLMTPQYAERISSRTVLFTSVPKEYLEESRLRSLFNNSVKNVWITGKTDDLDELVEERNKTALKLESAEVKLIKLVNKERQKALKKGGSDQAAEDTQQDAESGTIEQRWIPTKKRPSHRLGPLGLIGKKVDTIEWARAELEKNIPKAEAAQADYRAGKSDKVGAAFVEFHTQADAQAAYQVITHNRALQMSPKAIGVKPDEVVWSSLAIPWWQIVLRRYAVSGFILVFVVFFAIPVAIIGAVAQVSVLTKISALSWLNDIPKPLLGVISGLLPSVALAILMSLVPVIMRALAKKAGCVSLSQAELYTQNAYFFFQVVQVFLIQVLANGFISSVSQIALKPSSVFSVLSSQLPTTSNFYISYFILQGISISSGVITQVVGMLVFRILYKYLAGTPRAMYLKWTSLSAILWGSILPVYTCISVISITYAIIAPIILFWSALAHFLFYLAYRYNILFVSETTIDTRGRIYPRALKQLFVGIYLSEICLIGLFIVSKAAGPAVLEVFFLIVTILFNITVRRVFEPLLHALPRNLESLEHTDRPAALAGTKEADGVISNDASPEDGNGASNGASNGEKTEASASTPAGAEKKGNLFVKFLKPWKYADYETLRKIVPAGESIQIPHQYNDEIEANSYLPPSVTSPVPILWIPEDLAGVSKQEVLHTSKVIQITDEGATLDDKGTIHWDTEGARPPIYQEKIHY